MVLNESDRKIIKIVNDSVHLLYKSLQLIRSFRWFNWFFFFSRGKLNRFVGKKTEVSERIGFVVAKTLFHSLPASDVFTSCSLLLCVQMEWWNRDSLTMMSMMGLIGVKTGDRKVWIIFIHESLKVSKRWDNVWAWRPTYF